jgi:hypothetical protein
MPNSDGCLSNGICIQGYVYNCHPTHGFFIYFGHLNKETRVLSRFLPHGRLTRQGLPPGIVQRLAGRVVGGKRWPKPSDMLRVQVKTKVCDRVSQGAPWFSLLSMLF